MKSLIKNRLGEAINLELLESMLVDEDYPSSFNMDEFKKLSKFAERVRYCDQHLKKLSSGSARIVYIVDDTKVLKLAKNPKGVAQCETEIQWGGDYYFASILANVLESHPDGLWVEMELARKVKKSDFLNEVGVNIDDFAHCLRNREEENKGKRPMFSINPEVQDKFNNSDFANAIFEFMDAADAPAGDLGRLNSYGLVKRDGQNQIVIIDFGLTHDIYSTYYDTRGNR